MAAKPATNVSALYGATPKFVPAPPRESRGPVHTEADLATAKQILAQTWDSGEAAAFGVDEETAKKLTSLFRAASEHAGTGLSLKVKDDVLYVRAVEKRIVVKVEGKPRKPRATENRIDTEEYAQAMAQYEADMAEWQARQK